MGEDRSISKARGPFQMNNDWFPGGDGVTRDDLFKKAGDGVANSEIGWTYDNWVSEQGLSHSDGLTVSDVPDELKG